MTTGAPPPADDRHPSTVGATTLVVGAALVVLGAFLPWVISGTANRSSFATVRSADRLGVVPDGVALLLLRSWYLVPVAAAVVPALRLLHRPRLAALLALGLAVATASIATVIIIGSPATGAGPAVCLAGGAALVAGAALTLRRRPISGRHPTSTQ